MTAVLWVTWILPHNLADTLKKIILADLPQISDFLQEYFSLILNDKVYPPPGKLWSLSLIKDPPIRGQHLYNCQIIIIQRFYCTPLMIFKSHNYSTANNLY